MVGPTPDLSRSFQKKPPLTLTVKTVQRISWKEKENLLEIEQGSANLCCRGPDNTLGALPVQTKIEVVI